MYAPFAFPEGQADAKISRAAGKISARDFTREDFDAARCAKRTRKQLRRLRPPKPAKLQAYLEGQDSVTFAWLMARCAACRRCVEG